MWLSFHKVTTHSEKESHIRLRSKANNESANCATHSCDPAAFGACGSPPRCDSGGTRSTRWLIIVKGSIVFSSAPRLATGALIALLTCAILQSSVCVDLLQDVTPNARASYPSRWKNQPRPCCLVLRMNQSDHLVASPAKGLAARRS